MRRSTRIAPFALDLHVLGTPPAFVLSQDQTLQLKIEGFELAYLLLAPSSSDKPSRAYPMESGPNRSRCSGHAALARGLPRGSPGEGRAHPIELTAVSAIVLDLLSGFQRPSRRPPDRHRSVGGPTLLRSASEAVKHPAEGGNPVLSRTWTSIREVTWGLGEEPARR